MVSNISEFHSSVPEPCLASVTNLKCYAVLDLIFVKPSTTFPPENVSNDANEVHGIDYSGNIERAVDGNS
jgi:hypothetical protein